MNFFDFISKRTENELPADKAHLRMMPRFNEKAYRTLKPKETTRRSAVLVPLLPNNSGSFDLLLTLRSSKLKSHKGQISFPGGKAEANETAEETALRETYEEIGLSNTNFDIIGKLSDFYVYPSDSLITPVIAKAHIKDIIKINPDEVEEVFYVPFDQLLDSHNEKTKPSIIEGNNVEVPYWDIHRSTPLWGATAMILSELVWLWDEWQGKTPIPHKLSFIG